MDRRRVEGLLAPLAVLLVVGLVVTFVALRPGGDVGTPTAEESSSLPTASSTTGGEESGRGERRRRLPEADDLPTKLPDPSCRPEPRTRTVDALSFNIKSGKGAGRYDLDLIAREIEAWDVDIVLLQEVDRFRAVTRGTDQPAALAGRLGMEWAFGANVRRGGRSEYGTAILSRFPIVDTRNQLLPTGPGAQQRGLLSATVEIDDQEVSVYNTHLQHARPYEALRVAQSRALMGVVEADDRPTLLGGDFNAGPGTATMATATAGRMSDSWLEVGDGPGYTVPSVAAKARIDFLLHSPEFEPTGAEVLMSGISDHRAVRASYRLETSTSCLPPGSVTGG